MGEFFCSIIFLPLINQKTVSYNLYFVIKRMITNMNQ